MSKKIKALELDALRKTFGGVRDYVVLEPLKADAGAEYEFRKNLRARKVRVQLVKNTFAKKVFTEMGIAVDKVWAGPTMLCWAICRDKPGCTTYVNKTMAGRCRAW